jgi:hypothetical protein
MRMNVRWARLALTAAGLLVVGAGPVSATVIMAQPLPVTSYGCYENSSGGLESGAYTFFSTPTKWNPGPNTAQVWTGASPGGATWSIMGAGFVSDNPVDSHHGMGTTVSITSLGVSGWDEGDYSAMIDEALNVWAAVSGFSNLGLVADGDVNAGGPEADDGHLGDIRIAAWEITSSGTTLAHAFQPGTENEFGAGGTLAGDMHIDVNRTWVDDPTDTTSDGDFDLFTVVLHELGHSLGLNHSTESGSVMEANYEGARRTLHADDIAGIQALYGPAQAAPEPSSLLLLGTLGLGAVWRRRRRSGERAAAQHPCTFTS